MDPIGQQWWTSPGLGGPRLAPLFRRYSHVYENGEFTWAGLWTVTDPPVETHDELVGAWELWQPIGRWHLPVNDDVRVFEVHRPDDWVAVVSAFPAAVDETSEHVLPDWAAVALSFDAIHLSWAGFITTEGTATAMGAGLFTMLRYWGSERTHWLRDCFGEPTALDGDRRTSDRAMLRDLLGR
jgi:hypothetical protein